MPSHADHDTGLTTAPWLPLIRRVPPPLRFPEPKPKKIIFPEARCVLAPSPWTGARVALTPCFPNNALGSQPVQDQLISAYYRRNPMARFTPLECVTREGNASTQAR